MGKAAARATDTAMTCNDPADMPVGTVIAVGTVMINNLPAAKQGDQIVGVDTHIVMIPSPGGPVPTPLPHPFMGIIDNGLSSSVNIMGMPAATVDSEASNTPPHIPQGGPFQKPPTDKAKIMLGSPNVFIGNGGGGSGSGSGGGDSASGTAEAAQVETGHTLDVKFVDKGGKPISGASYSVKTPDGRTLDGILAARVKRSGLDEGNYEIALSRITKAEWSPKTARNGEKVKLLMEGIGFEKGAEAAFEIWVKDIGRPDRKAKTFSEIAISGGKAEAEWTYSFESIEEPTTDTAEESGEQRRGYSSPRFYFIVTAGSQRTKSQVLDYKDYVEIELVDKDGNAMANEEYILRFSNGEVRRGTLNGSGTAREEKVPPSRHTVEYPNQPTVTKVD